MKSLCSLVNATEGSVWRLSQPQDCVPGDFLKRERCPVRTSGLTGELSGTRWWAVQMRKLRTVLGLFSDRVLSGYGMLICRFLLKLEYILFDSVLESRRSPGFFSVTFNSFFKFLLSPLTNSKLLNFCSKATFQVGRNFFF